MYLVVTVVHRKRRMYFGGGGLRAAAVRRVCMRRCRSAPHPAIPGSIADATRGAGSGSDDVKVDFAQ